MLNPLWQNFLDPRMASNLWQAICYRTYGRTDKRIDIEHTIQLFTIINGGNIATETFYTKDKIKSFIKFDEERCGLIFLVNVKFSTKSICKHE